MIITDTKNKILWITSHKSVVSTITTFIMNIYFDNQYNSGYYYNFLFFNN